MVWPFVTRRGILGTILVVLVVGGFATAFMSRPDFFVPGNRGFGPDWDCVYPGKGEPICVKRVPPLKNPQ